MRGRTRPNQKGRRRQILKGRIDTFEVSIIRQTAVGLVQKLSQAKNLEDVVKIQTEFMSKQLGSFNEQTKTIVEICTKAAQEATKRSS
jgi:hypothetical protein